MIDNVFIEISVIILIALACASLARALKQPLIIGYILAGILLSPYFLGLVQTPESLDTFAQIGVVILLFMVGIHLNPKVIKDVGKPAVITGLGQIIFTSTIGFAIAMLMGFNTVTALYIAIALTFSSTIIIMKLLSDKGDMETLYGKIAVGFLIVQDIVVVLILMLVSSIGTGNADTSIVILSTLGKGLGLILIAAFLAIFVIPKILKPLAKSQELILLFAVSWCMIAASAFYYFNLSIEIGALLAGVALSVSPYRHEISSRVKPLRDFFILLFFILLGVQMQFENISEYIIPAIIFSLFVLIGNPLIVMTLMGILGYKHKNSFKAGLTVAQISEFSLILVALGIRVGHIENEILSFITIIGLITIAGSSYFIMHSDKIYSHIGRYLKVFERSNTYAEDHKHPSSLDYEVILFGYNRIGFDLVKAFNKLNKKYIVVDFNPDVIKTLQEQNIDCVYGDAEDTDFLSELDIKKVKLAVSTIPNVDTNLTLATHIKGVNKNTILVTVAHQIEDALELYKENVDYVIMPHFLGGQFTSALLETFAFDRNRFEKEKAKHLKYLTKRQSIGHEHPRHL